VIGSYHQDAVGMMVAGFGFSTSSQLMVTGNVTLDGILQINLLRGFTPFNGQLFDLISFSGVESGQFSGILGASQAFWTVLYNPNNNGKVDLQYNHPVSGVPEPNFVFLNLAVGLALVLVWRRRKKAEAV
jgi:hypothetical protein